MTNRHDRWIEFREQKATVFAEMGLPKELITSERVYTSFLTDGHYNGVDVTLECHSDIGHRTIK